MAMDNEKIAGELVRIARDLTGGDAIEDLVEDVTKGTRFEYSGSNRGLGYALAFLTEANSDYGVEVEFKVGKRDVILTASLQEVSDPTRTIKKTNVRFDLDEVSQMSRWLKKTYSLMLTSALARQHTAGELVRTAADGIFLVKNDVEVAFNPWTRLIEVGMGGEWWSGKIKPGKNVLNHPKESGDPGYKPVTVQVKEVSKGYSIAVFGGFGMSTTVLLTLK